MLTDLQREQVVTETKSWIGTPYRGWSCVKGCGTDCGQLLYGVYRNCGLLPVIELPRDYSLQVALHRVSTEYVDLVAQYFRVVPEADAKAGDIVVYKLGHAYAHAGIIVEWPRYVIQAVSGHGVSGTHGIQNPAFRRRDRLFFTLKDEHCEGTK